MAMIGEESSNSRVPVLFIHVEISNSHNSELENAEIWSWSAFKTMGSSSPKTVLDIQVKAIRSEQSFGNGLK